MFRSKLTDISRYKWRIVLKNSAVEAEGIADSFRRLGAAFDSLRNLLVVVSEIEEISVRVIDLHDRRMAHRR
jgi:hypothetical protein